MSFKYDHTIYFVFVCVSSFMAFIGLAAAAFLTAFIAFMGFFGFAIVSCDESKVKKNANVFATQATLARRETTLDKLMDLIICPNTICMTHTHEPHACKHMCMLLCVCRCACTIALANMNAMRVCVCVFMRCLYDCLSRFF